MTQSKTIKIPLPNGETIYLNPVRKGYDILFSDGVPFEVGVPLFGMGLALHYPGLDWFNYYLTVVGVHPMHLDFLTSQLQTKQCPATLLTLRRDDELLKAFNGEILDFEAHLKTFDLGFVTVLKAGELFSLLSISAHETLGDAFSLDFLNQAFAFAAEQLRKPEAPSLSYDLSQLNPNWNLPAFLFALQTERNYTISKPETVQYQKRNQTPIDVPLRPMLEVLKPFPSWVIEYLYYLGMGYPIPVALSYVKNEIRG